MNSWQYQIFGSSCAVSIRMCVVDADILRIAGISADLWCPVDFASDLSVLKLASYETLHSLCGHHIYRETKFSASNIGSLIVTFVIIKPCFTCYKE